MDLVKSHFISYLKNDKYSKCHFLLKNGLVCEGFIEEIYEDSFLFYSSGPLTNQKPIILKFDCVKVDSIEYFDSNLRKWIIIK